MSVPFEGELTATEQRAYDAITDPILPVFATRSIAHVLKLDEQIVAGVCDGLEAMGFIEKRGGLWTPV